MSVELVDEHRRHRRTLWRMVLMYTPATVAAAAIASISIVSLVQGRLGAAFPALLLVAVTGALAYQSIAAARDLRAVPTFTRGPILSRWTKGQLLVFFRAHHLRLDRGVFTVRPEAYVHLDRGDVVEIHHWPHSKTVIRVYRLRGRDADGDGPVEGSYEAPISASKRSGPP